jgi:EthD domain
MEKLIYVLEAPESGDRATFVRQLLEAGKQMVDLEPSGLRLNVQDAHVDWGDATEHHPALGLHSPYGPFEAVVQLWLDGAAPSARAPFEALIRDVAPRAHGYMVEERLLAYNLRQSAAPGERNDGYSQIAMLQIPDRLSREEWLKAWQDRHTWVALSIHPHLEYIQNVVLQAVTKDAPPIAGVGEEAFPIEGLHDERPLFRGADTDEKYEELHQVMYEDAARFIDFDRLDMMVSSQFDLRPPER